MNKEEIKEAIGKLEPDSGMGHRLARKVLHRQNKKATLKPLAAIAVSLTLVICLGISIYNYTENENINITENQTNNPTNVTDSTEGIYLSKIELPKDTNAKMDMIGLIVYQGKIYTQSGTKIEIEKAEKLLGEKLGTTKGNIDEWSKQQDYDIELASTTGITDVFAVKGYDKNFRIMTYGKIEGNGYAEFYECLNGVRISKGSDIFGKLKMENNIKTAKFESYDSWNNSKQQYKELPKLNTLSDFVNELQKSTPYTRESLEYLWTTGDNTNRKILYVSLKDGCEIQLQLFKEGYLYYGYSGVFFKVDSGAFNKFWGELK